MPSSAHASDVPEALKASMIWTAAAPSGEQTYAAFRRSFDLSEVPSTAPLHLFADSRYMLWVNGEQVLRGPSRFHPKSPEYDTLDIKPWLRSGTNSLVVLVHHYSGGINGRIMNHVPGLTALLVVDGREVVRTGSDWKSSIETEYQPSPGAWSSIPDVIDGRKWPGDWTSPTFDDSTWARAIATDGSAWGNFRPRISPLCKEEEMTGLRIMPEGKPLPGQLPISLNAGETRPWSYPGGFTGKWMWAPGPAEKVCFKAVWSNAGFGVGKGSSIKVLCDNRFILYQNNREIARSNDLQTGWTGNIDVADGDVIAIEAEDLENGDHSAGLFVSMLNHGHAILSTSDFRCAAGAVPADWKSSSDLSDFTALSNSNIHPAHQGMPDGQTSVVIDLGRMAMAYPAIELEAEEGSVLQLEYALRFIDGKPAETYGVGTTYTARAGRQLFIAADQWCARYVTVTCLSGRVKLLSMKMTSREYPYERVGGFTCADPLLTQLWDMAVRTVEVTTDDAHGSDARERNEWVQDGSKASFNTMRVAAAGPDGKGGRICSDTRTLRKLISDAAACQMPDGRLPGTFPTDRGAEDPHHFIDDYAMQWVESLRWHHDLTGDTAFVREMWPALLRQMQWFLDRRTPRRLLLAREYASFDNPIAYLTCEGATINAFFYHALRDAAHLARAVGNADHASSYHSAADALAIAYNKHLWDENEHAYSAGFLNDEKLTPSVHAQLMALYSGIVPADRLAATRGWFLANFKNPGAAITVGVKENRRQLLDNKAGLGMPIMFYWAFTEIYRIDSPEADRLALSEMRDRWKNMVNFLQDAGTLSESFVNDQGGGMSESCHNYGSIPAYFISSYLLGVRLDGPVDKKRIVINPRPAELAEAGGTVVTPFGPVPVEWTIRNGDWCLRFTVPDGVTAELRLPDVDPSTLTLNGSAMPTATQGRNTLLTVGPGTYQSTAKLRSQ